MKYKIFLVITSLVLTFSCEDKFTRTCMHDRLSYDAIDSFSMTEYSIYTFLLEERQSNDFTYILQETTNISIKVVIQYATHNIDSIMLDNYYSRNSQNYNLNPDWFQDIKDVCVVPKSEFEIVTHKYDWVPLIFSRIGFNTDSTEALVSYIEESGFLTLHLNCTGGVWEKQWISGGGDH